MLGTGLELISFGFRKNGELNEIVGGTGIDFCNDFPISDANAGTRQILCSGVNGIYCWLDVLAAAVVGVLTAGARQFSDGCSERLVANTGQSRW